MEQIEQKEFDLEFVVRESQWLSPWNDDAVLEFEFMTDSVEEAMRLASEQAAPHRHDSDHYLVFVMIEAVGRW